jgi:hypothetical protein
MKPPDQRLFEADLLSAEFRNGVVKGIWGCADADALPAGATWPKVFFWIAASPRANAPDRFFIGLDTTGYRTVPPTGAFWDPFAKAVLEVGKWPKGKCNSRFVKIFRTDWEYYTANDAAGLNFCKSRRIFN